MALPGNKPSGYATGGAAPAAGLPGAAPAAGVSGGLPGAKPAAGGGAKSKKKGETLLGINLPKLPLIHKDLPTIGIHVNGPGPLSQARDLVAGAIPGLVRLGGQLGSELRPSNPFKVVHALPAQERGWQNVQKEMPVTAAAVQSVGRTARQIPDTAVAVRPGGPGFGQSDLGRQIKEEGVLPTALAKVADLSLLTGAGGLVGKALGAGHLAEAARLERLASLTSEAAGLSKIPNEAALARAASVADAAGQGAKALDLAKAADQVALASKLREGFGGSLAERATAGAGKAAHIFGRTAAAPFAPSEKALGLVGKGLGVLARSERVAPFVAQAEEAVARMKTRQVIGDLHHETVVAPYQAEMHELFQRGGMEEHARNLSRDEQAAVYLGGKSLEGLTPGVREFMDAAAELPDEIRPDVVKQLFPDGSVTPEQVELARRFNEGTLPEKQQAKMQAASDALTKVQKAREDAVYAPGRGTGKPLSEAALEARRQRAAGESATMDVNRAVDKATGPTRERIASIEDEANRLATEPREPAPLTGGQKKQQIIDQERVRQSRVRVDQARRGGDAGALAKAERQLARDERGAQARAGHHETEAQQRADRAAERRQTVLDKQHARATDTLTKETEAARNSVEAAPPQDRPALQVAHRAKELALHLAEALPERAAEFKGLADDIATSKAALEAKGVKTEYFFGGEALDKHQAPPSTAKLRRAVRLQSERNRVSGSLARDIKSQTEKHAQETLGILNNEFRGKAQETLGSTVGDELGLGGKASAAGPAGGAGHLVAPTGAELGAQLAEHDLVAWDPKTGKLLDAADITPESAVLPADVHEQLTKYTAPKRPGMALRYYDKATGKWKHTVLALSPRWHVGNVIGNAAMATLGAGLSPAAVARNVGEARRLIKAYEGGGEVPAEHVEALRRLLAAGFHNPDLGEVESASRLGKLIGKSYAANEYIDSVNRVTVYLAKHKGGISSDAAVQLALKAAGDFSKMTPFERQVMRRIVPFYAWQRHITRLAFSLPLEAPARVAWTLHLADLENKVHPDAGADNSFNAGSIPSPFGLDLGPVHVKRGDRLSVRSANPYTSSFFVDPSLRGAGYALNPLLKGGIVGLTGLSPNSGFKPLTSPETDFGSGPKPGFENLPRLAQYLAEQIPQVRSAQDLAEGDVPVRYETGQPRHVGKGSKKKPTLTGRGRTETLMRLLGVPFPEPENKQLSKKR